MVQQLTLFISSKMLELAGERRAVQEALRSFKMHGWLWETSAGARPEPVRSTYLKEVADSDIYIGLFWLGYGPYTIEEFEHARNLRKPCLVYEKFLDLDRRDPRLSAFLLGLQSVENREGLTTCRFETTEQLAAQVQDDVIRLLTTVFRETRLQPPARPTSPARSKQSSVSARNHSIAIGGHVYGTVEQHNYGNVQPEDEEE
jgi:hypothetical protein